MAAKGRRRGGWVVPSVLMLAIGSCIVTMPTKEKTPAEREADKFLKAMIRCENETKSRLADREGFEAAPYGDWRVVPDEVGGGLTFGFKARARNAYGALIWAEFTCHATYNGERWTAEISQK